VQLDLDGYPVTVIDTAGIRETDDPIEQEGVRRAKSRAAEADLVLWLVEDETHEHAVQGAAPVWLVRNKIDLNALSGVVAGMGQTWGSAYFEISAARGDGLQELMTGLVDHAENVFGSGEGGLINRERQRKLLRETAALLQRSMDAGENGEELVAEDLRAAAHSLGQLLGRVDVEDVLDKIFREFCVGK
jgi:tRNA modification GTPase